MFEGIRFHGAWATSVRQEVEQAPRTLRNMRSVWVKEFEAVVENDQVSQFRAILKIAFKLDEGANARSTRSMGSEEILGLG
ncbi:hypothetical protein BB934_44170 (plasmid) [Microvirga ossetica]|uniref:Uncharacterized protein n=1 Tax=Microvirga ossetica TaxID=1882682 RepID=A0A1B2EY32_9HYPH|nr:hypothetical protein BB934_40520 [Microvirga ossetica]ANY85371.1 hypothetical protein BB934_44170 [Microvirga ossetica]